VPVKENGVDVIDFDRTLATCIFEIDKCNNIKQLEEVRSAIFGKNGTITDMLKSLKNMPHDEKCRYGAEVNAGKKVILQHIEKKAHSIEVIELERKLSSEFTDTSMPARCRPQGRIHPLTKVKEELSEIMLSYGFSFENGPDIESEFFNFTALNIPEHHPARTMHDTFYISSITDHHGRKLLRTHTSNVQIRTMLAGKPPLRMFSIGRVFRSDYDATHTPMFNQMEGLMVDKNVGFSNLKWLLTDLLKRFFAIPNLTLRFRPSFFPFTEPSAEVDMNYDILDGKMKFGVGSKWLEIGGAGVVHPNVLEYGNVDSKKYQGIAFGFGLERLTSLKYGIPDLRDYFESNDRWRDTFGFCNAIR
jgi:phenylalanyl-tRNA synthetase alpha chain